MAINHEFDRSPDVLEQADQATEMFKEAGISQAQKAVAPETHPDFDGMHCVGLPSHDCGEVIPDARLALNRVRCVRCQGLLERQQRFYAGR